VNRALLRHREEILERQYVQERLAAAATELFASACVLSRRDAELRNKEGAGSRNGAEESVADLFVRGSFARIEQSLSELHHNCDALVTRTADSILAGNQ